jgi:hypothetical protein
VDLSLSSICSSGSLFLSSLFLSSFGLVEYCLLCMAFVDLLAVIPFCYFIFALGIMTCICNSVYSQLNVSADIVQCRTWTFGHHCSRPGTDTLLPFVAQGTNVTYIVFDSNRWLSSCRDSHGENVLAHTPAIPDALCSFVEVQVPCGSFGFSLTVLCCRELLQLFSV